MTPLKWWGPLLYWTTLWVCWGAGQVRGVSPPGPCPLLTPLKRQGWTGGEVEREQGMVRVRRKAADSTQLWPDAVVPFAFLPPEPERDVVLEGLGHWEQNTCLRFLPVNDTSLPHLQFRKLSGCRSGVGIEGAAGQNISIGDNCNKVGIVIHEVGHAVGLYHEIRRPDRDSQVVVNEDNILTHELYNFYKLHWLDVTVKYDLSSVMHYHTLEWSANGRTTVATKDPMLQGLLGGWKRTSTQGLSHRDAFLANHIYGCLDEWLERCGLNRNPCKNEGYLGLTCDCVCPPGTEGRTCQNITAGYYDHLESPCSQTVTYPTVLTSPHYPANYDADTWCVYRIEAPECQAPEVTVLDLQLGPRDHRDHCYTDYLEVRNASLYDGFLVCGSEVAPGTVWQATTSTLILYFNGESGGLRGFKVAIRFTSIPGCCRSHSNSSSTFFLHSPGYPNPFNGPFNCSYSLPAEAPARVAVAVRLVGEGSSITLRRDWTCALILCQPDGRCVRYCRLLQETRRRRRRRKRKRRQEEEEEEEGGRSEEVVVPNVGSLHLLQHPSTPLLPPSSSTPALQVSFTLQDSPCHQVVFVNRSDPRGWISVGPRATETLQCEWWITAPRGSHVKVRVEEFHLPDDEDSYLAVNEAGEASFPAASTRVYRGGQQRAPPVLVSLQNTICVVVQGAPPHARLTLHYQLYECDDDNSECQYWAADGECQGNPLWMQPHCRTSCRRCDYSVTCEDRHPDCQFWADHQQCEENRLWMAVHCSRACGHCEVCEDDNRWCPKWSSKGECEANPGYMRTFCRKSCGACLLPNHANSTEPPSTTLITISLPTTTTTSTTTGHRQHHLSNHTATPDRGRTPANQHYEDNETTRGIAIHHKPTKQKHSRLKLKPSTRPSKPLLRPLKPGRRKSHKRSKHDPLGGQQRLTSSPPPPRSTPTTITSTINMPNLSHTGKKDRKLNREFNLVPSSLSHQEPPPTAKPGGLSETPVNTVRPEEVASELSRNATSTRNSPQTPQGQGDAFLKGLIRNQHHERDQHNRFDNSEASQSKLRPPPPPPAERTANQRKQRGQRRNRGRKWRGKKRRRNQRHKGRWRSHRPRKTRKRKEWWSLHAQKPTHKHQEGIYHKNKKRRGGGGGGRQKWRQESRNRKKQRKRGGRNRQTIRGWLQTLPPPSQVLDPVLAPSLPTTTTPASATLRTERGGEERRYTTQSTVSPIPSSSPAFPFPSLHKHRGRGKPKDQLKRRPGKTRVRRLHSRPKTRRGGGPLNPTRRKQHYLNPAVFPRLPQTSRSRPEVTNATRREGAEPTSPPVAAETQTHNTSPEDSSSSGQESDQLLKRQRKSDKEEDKRRRKSPKRGRGDEEEAGSYAEWGIGPIRAIHRPRFPPTWRFRKGFYRRGEHVYEDDHP